MAIIELKKSSVHDLRKKMAKLLVASLALGANAFAPPSVASRRCPRMRATASEVVESSEESCVTFTIDIPGSLTTAAWKTAAAELAQKEAIPGWRAKDWKKIPAGVVANAVGAATMKSLAIEKLSETEVHSAISGLGVEPVGQAQLVGTPEELVAGFKAGEDYAMRVKVDVWPEAVWDSPYDDGSLAVEVEREARDFSVRDKAMEALRERYCDTEDAGPGHAARAGDVAIVDLEGYLRGENGENEGPLPINAPVGGDDLELVLEAGKFLPGVVEALIGLEAGAAVTVPVDFPESKAYRDVQPLAGVKAAFDVKIKQVKVRTLPPLDDAFASKIRAGLTLAELQQEVENTVGSKEDDKTQERLHQVLEIELGKKLSMALPEAVVVESAKQKFAVMLSDMRSQGTPDDTLKQMTSVEGFQKFLKVVRPKVEDELRAKLAVESVSKLAAIALEPASVDEQMELVKRQFEAQQLKGENEGATFNDEKAREKVESELLRVMVLDHVATKAKITYVDPKPVPEGMPDLPVAA